MTFMAGGKNFESSSILALIRSAVASALAPAASRIAIPDAGIPR